MKFKELKNLDSKTLTEKLNEAKLTLMKENAQVAIGTIPKSPSKIKNVKKTISKIKLLLSTKNNGETKQ